MWKRVLTYCSDLAKPLILGACLAGCAATPSNQEDIVALVTEEVQQAVGTPRVHVEELRPDQPIERVDTPFPLPSLQSVVTAQGSGMAVDVSRPNYGTLPGWEMYPTKHGPTFYHHFPRYVTPERVERFEQRGIENPKLWHSFIDRATEIAAFHPDSRSWGEPLRNIFMLYRNTRRIVKQGLPVGIHNSPQSVVQTFDGGDDLRPYARIGGTYDTRPVSYSDKRVDLSEFELSYAKGRLRGDLDLNNVGFRDIQTALDVRFNWGNFIEIQADASLHFGGVSLSDPSGIISEERLSDIGYEFALTFEVLTVR